MIITTYNILYKIFEFRDDGPFLVSVERTRDDRAGGARSQYINYYRTHTSLYAL